MKLKKLAAIATALLFDAASASTAPFFGNGTATSVSFTPLQRIRKSSALLGHSQCMMPSYNATSATKRNPPQHVTPTASWPAQPRFGKTSARPRNIRSLTTFTGSNVEPGRKLSRAERQNRIEQARADSIADLSREKSLSEQREEEQTFHNLGKKISLAFWNQYSKLEPKIRGVWESLRVNTAPAAVANAIHDFRGPRGHLHARTTIISLMIFAVVFGTMLTLSNYLLIALRASAQCNASTVFFPVTYTYTTSVMVSPTACLPQTTALTFDPTSSVPSMVTHTETSTTYRMSTVTVTATATLADGSSSSTTLPYMFSGDSSTTSWLNGNSPSSGVSVVVATTTVPIYPATSTPSGSTITLHSTLTNLITVSPPVYTSTVFSLAEPDTTSTTYITRTQTISSLTTITRSSFSGVATSGWNMTSATSSQVEHSDVSAVPLGTPTTATVTYYWATGSQTYSTKTTVLTTTLYTPIPLATTVTLNGTTVTASVSKMPHSSSGTVVSVADAGTRSPMNSNVGSQSPSFTSRASSFLSTGSPSSISTGTAATMHTTLSAGAPFAANSSSSSFLSRISTQTLGSAGTATLSSQGLSSSSINSVHSTISGMPIVPANSTILAGTGVSSQQSESQITATSQSVQGSSLANGVSTTSTTGATSSAVFRSASTASPATTRNASSFASPGYGDPSLSAGPTTARSSAATLSSLKSVKPSTQALSSLGSSFANGPGSTASFSEVSSAIPSTQALSSAGSSLALGSSSISSQNATSTPGSTPKASSSSISSTTLSRLSSTSGTSTRTTITSTVASMAPMPTVCGEHGDFTLNFDDLPSFTPSNANQTDMTQAPPVFSPYHHLTFSDGYVHAPPPDAPYRTHSGKQMAVFLGNASSNASTEDSAMFGSSRSGRIQPGEINDGPYDGDSAYWFNPHTAWLGCDNAGPAPCTFKVTGWKWDPTTNEEIPAYNTQYNLPPCPSLQNCELSEVTFPPSFQGLSGLQIQSYVGTEQRMFFMDDLAMGWYNNTCAAGLQRQGGPHSSGPGNSGAGAGKKRGVRRFIR